MTKKSNFKVIVESIENGDIAKVNLDNLTRHITMSELRQIVKEEFGAVVAVSDTEPEECDFSDAEVENAVDWIKALKLQESV